MIRIEDLNCNIVSFNKNFWGSGDCAIPSVNYVSAVFVKYWLVGTHSDVIHFLRPSLRLY